MVYVQIVLVSFMQNMIIVEVQMFVSKCNEYILLLACYLCSLL
jgi:hypothetical protein